jgi:hypothetical protein
MGRWIKVGNAIIDLDAFYSFGVRRCSQEGEPERWALCGFPRVSVEGHNRVFYVSDPSSKEDAVAVRQELAEKLCGSN